MVHDTDSEQEDLFPKELAEEQSANEKRVADERIRAKVELKNRIDGFWNKLCLDKLKDWRFDRKTIADWRFDYRSGAGGDLELMFYFPTGDDLELTDEEYEQYSFELKNLLTPLEENVDEDWGLSFFLSWRIESYEDAMEFAPSRGRRSKS